MKSRWPPNGHLDFITLDSKYEQSGFGCFQPCGCTATLLKCSTNGQKQMSIEHNINPCGQTALTPSELCCRGEVCQLWAVHEHPPLWWTAVELRSQHRVELSCSSYTFNCISLCPHPYMLCLCFHEIVPLVLAVKGDVMHMAVRSTSSQTAHLQAGEPDGYVEYVTLDSKCMQDGFFLCLCLCLTFLSFWFVVLQSDTACTAG